MTEYKENVEQLARCLASAAGVAYVPAHVVRRIAVLVDVDDIRYLDSDVAKGRDGATDVLSGAVLILTEELVVCVVLEGTKATPAGADATVTAEAWSRRLLESVSLVTETGSDEAWSDDLTPVPTGQRLELVYAQVDTRLTLRLNRRHAAEFGAVLPTLLRDLSRGA
ncbi:MAG: hypothetical protein JWM02_1398 [Frankiales bacterium]|nr:hypothetical protein [Frankiales bacterium]